jgi:hypothetical protein
MSAPAGKYLIELFKPGGEGADVEHRRRFGVGTIPD